MQFTFDITFYHLKKALLKFLLVVVFFSTASLLFAQERGNSAVVYQVSEGETFASIAAKYNISPHALADYNNLDYYDGPLISKSLRIPPKKKEGEPKKEVDKIAEETTIENSLPAKVEETKIENNLPAKLDSRPDRKQPVTTTATSPAPARPVAEVQQKDTKTESVVPSVTPNDSNIVKGSSRFPPFKEMLPIIIFLITSIILLIVAIIFYKSLQR